MFQPLSFWCPWYPSFCFLGSHFTFKLQFMTYLFWKKSSLTHVDLGCKDILFLSCQEASHVLFHGKLFLCSCKTLLFLLFLLVNEHGIVHVGPYRDCISHLTEPLVPAWIPFVAVLSSAVVSCWVHFIRICLTVASPAMCEPLYQLHLHFFPMLSSNNPMGKISLPLFTQEVSEVRWG